MALQLAMEIPTPYLKDFAPLCDLDFILAHKVLEDPAYTKFFHERDASRELILDNSTHEFGKPLPMDNLRTAAELCRANYVVAPDIIPDTSKEGAAQLSSEQFALNRQWLRDASAGLPDSRIAAVVCGNTQAEFDRFVDNMYLQTRATMVCFTFHNPDRLRWWHWFRMNNRAWNYNRFHILGVSTLTELKSWVVLSEKYPQFTFSVDTTKCFKWGAQLKRIDEMDDLRGGPIDAKAVLNLEKLSDAQLSCVKHNVEVLRRLCLGTEEKK